MTTISAALPRMGRVTRNPTHNWSVKAKPFVIQPIVIAPVLPAETMKNALFQARVITDPIKNPLIGWWKEYYFFYVKHRNLIGGEDFTEMMLDLNYDISAQKAAADAPNLYTKTGQVDWVRQCLNAVVAEYFRYEGEAPATIDGLPIAGIGSESWFQSLMANNDANANDFNVDLDSDGSVEASEIERSMIHWEFLKANNMTDMSYEDYLATFGIRRAKEERNVPELLRYVREWTYPVNTIDPTNGAPSSACSWAISERMDKDRFFKEPGFIFGVSVTRPKIYFSGQTGAAVGLLDNALSWLPAIMRDEVNTSLKQLEANSCLTNATEGTWFDIRDLFVYGDQFTNRLGDDINAVALPDSALQSRFPTSANITSMFVNAGSENVREDGVCRLTILGTQQDMTPRGSPSGSTAL